MITLLTFLFLYLALGAACGLYAICLLERDEGEVCGYEQARILLGFMALWPIALFDIYLVGDGGANR